MSSEAPASEPAGTPARQVMLYLVQDWLGVALRLPDANVTSVGRSSGDLQSSEYAAVFAQAYNDLVGMGRPGDLVRLYDGRDPRGTGPFIAGLLTRYGCRKVIDTCGGCQYDAIYLAGAAARGEVILKKFVSNEMDEELLAQGRRNLAEVRSARPIGDPLPSQHPWQVLSRHFASGAFDASLCLGNSLPHLSDAAQRRRATANFAAITRTLTLVETRNFDQMLMNTRVLKERAREFIGSGASGQGNRALFPGSVAHHPVYITEDVVIIAYARSGERTPFALVQFFPLTRDTLVSELRQFFGRVEVCHDRRPRQVSHHELGGLEGPGSIQYICTQPLHEAAAKAVEEA